MSKNSAFFYPTKSHNDSSDSPGDKVNKQIRGSETKNNAIINLTQGKVSHIKLEGFRNNKTSGRTLNVPKTTSRGIIPSNTYNSGITIGQKCVGVHCAIPVPPTAMYMTNVNLRSANPPPGALTQFASSYRPGNNSDVNVGIGKYTNDSSRNHGPFNISVQRNEKSRGFITNPETGKRVRVSSNEGKYVLETYRNYY